MGKIYCYYAILENEYVTTDYGLYAFTENKELAKRFESERNMELFRKRIQRTDDFSDEETYRSFLVNERNRMMIEIPLTDKDGNDVSLVGTYKEDLILSEEFDMLINDIDDVLSNVATMEEHGEIQEGFTDLIGTFLSYYKSYSVMDATVDTFHLFVQTFWSTFYSTDYVLRYAESTEDADPYGENE